MNLVFMGTPDFSAAFLSHLVESSHRVVAVVTQPDKPAGRGRVLTPPPVKEKALQLGIPVFQPTSLSDESFLNEIIALHADLSVVVAFSILPKVTLAATRLGAINLHGSLLPRYRGAAPVQWAVADGLTETGLSVFLLDEKMDHGPLLVQRRVPIGPEDTGAQVLETMIPEGCLALDQALDGLSLGHIIPLPQDHTQATPARKLRKEDGLFDWKLPARTLKNRLRGFYPWPGGYSYLQGKKISFHLANVVNAGDMLLAPGEVFVTHDSRLLVGTGHELIELLIVQAEGKKAMPAQDFIRGLQRNATLVFNNLEVS